MELVKIGVSSELQKKILTAIELKKELEVYEKEIKDALRLAMEEYEVDSIKTEDFTASMVTRTTYSASGEIPKNFQKVVLDTKKVADSVLLYGGVPDGIEAKQTKYISWRAK